MRTPSWTWWLITLASVAAVAVGGVAALVRSVSLPGGFEEEEPSTSPAFVETAPYPTLELRPIIHRDPSRTPIQLAGSVVAYIIVDERGTVGVEIFDTITEASYGWIPGRSPAVFMGNAETDSSCQCEVWDRGWSRILPFTGNTEALQRLIDGQPYQDPGVPTGPPPSARPGGCSGPECPTPSPPTATP